MKTFYYEISEEEIEIGCIYHFGQLWAGWGGGKKILSDGHINFYDYDDDRRRTIYFDIVVYRHNPSQTLIKVTDIQ